jgi:hypothetical protein
LHIALNSAGRSRGLAGGTRLHGSRQCWGPLLLPVVPLALSMPLSSLFALLVTPAGLAHPLASRQCRTLLRAVPIATIALSTNRHLLTASSTQEETDRLARSLLKPRCAGMKTHGCAPRQCIRRGESLLPRSCQFLASACSSNLLVADSSCEAQASSDGAQRTLLSLPKRCFQHMLPHRSDSYNTENFICSD